MGITVVILREKSVIVLAGTTATESSTDDFIQRGISTGADRVVVVVGRECAIVKFLSMPKFPREEQYSAIRMQLQKALPREIESYYYTYSYVETPATETQPSKLLLTAIAVNKTTVDPILKGLADKNIKCEGLFLSSEVLARNLNPETKVGIFITGENSDVVYRVNGRFTASLLMETPLLTAAARSGSVGSLLKSALGISEEIDSSAISEFSQASTNELIQNVLTESLERKKNGVSNLLVSPKERKRLVHPAVAVGVVALLVLIGGYVYCESLVSKEETDARNLAAKNATLKQKNEKLKKLKETLDFCEEWGARRHDPLKVFAEIDDILKSKPDPIYDEIGFKRLAYDVSRRGVTVSGLAVSDAAVLKFVNKTNSTSKMLEASKPKSMKKASKPVENFVVEFDIEMKLK